MPRVVLDPSLSARVVARRPLLYAQGADPKQDRPAHVRAGSGMAWWRGRLAVVQDDARFIALCDPTTGLADAVALPAGADGLRLHDDTRGTKALKLDLEACVLVDVVPGPLLLALGSGSTSAREHIALMRDDVATGAPTVEVVDAHALYAALRACERFAGSELNVEGVARIGPSLRLFQRGNGASREGRAPVSATCDLELVQLLAHLAHPDRPPPSVERVVRWDFPEVDGAPLGFTDAFATDDEILFLAAAERSRTATDDGPVSGVALGRMARDLTSARLCLIRSEDGTPLLAKAEGIVLDPHDPTHAWVVVDRDDPAAASELCELHLA